MASKSKIARQGQEKNQKLLQNKLIGISALVLLIKFVVLANIPGHFWLGADGENYLTALEALIKDGVFSQEHLLSYWPAGYPLLMFIIAQISIGNTLILTVIFQSIFYAVACAFFVMTLSRTNLRKFMIPTALVLGFNPTLSLSTLTIGYESISASIFLICIALLAQEFYSGGKRLISHRSIVAAFLLSLSAFVQPRFLLSGFVFFVIWGVFLKGKKAIAFFLAVSVLILSILPAGLILRNSKANNFAAVSTNLGITMNLGAGPGATGAYIKSGYGVPCDPIEGNDAQQDSHLRNCVISWYISNPAKSAELFYNKAKFFWSPWSGPEASGSMARNPWLKVNPLVSIARDSQEGNSLVFGNFGKFVSWSWVLGSLTLLAIGSWRLLGMSGILRVIGFTSVSFVVLNWAISIGTLGDHRQRLPIMTLSLFLQTIGALSLLNKRKYRIEPD